jgi:hypothetical protein
LPIASTALIAGLTGKLHRSHQPCAGIAGVDDPCEGVQRLHTSGETLLGDAIPDVDIHPQRFLGHDREAQSVNELRLLMTAAAGDVDSACLALAILDKDVGCVDVLPTEQDEFAIDTCHLNNTGKALAPVDVAGGLVYHLALPVLREPADVSVRLLNAHAIEHLEIVRKFDLGN